MLRCEYVQDTSTFCVPLSGTDIGMTYRSFEYPSKKVGIPLNYFIELVVKKTKKKIDEKKIRRKMQGYK